MSNIYRYIIQYRWLRLLVIICWKLCFVATKLLSLNSHIGSHIDQSNAFNIILHATAFHVIIISRFMGVLQRAHDDVNCVNYRCSKTYKYISQDIRSKTIIISLIASLLHVLNNYHVQRAAYCMINISVHVIWKIITLYYTTYMYMYI